MITYLIEASFCSILFYLVYWIFFKLQTNHNFNRFYLLSAIIFSFLIPWMEIVISAKTVILETALNNTVIENVTPQISRIPPSNLLTIFYLVGFTISLSYFLIKLAKLLTMIMRGEKRKVNNQNIIVVKDEIEVCSFFNKIIVSDTKQDQLSQYEIAHEKAHINQFHSIDIIIAWLYQSIFWFNPIAYFYKSRFMEVHEFLADKTVIKQLGKSKYQEYILNLVSLKVHPQLAHNFKSILKTRLIMMNSNSKPNKGAYLIAFGVLVSTIFLFSCHTKKAAEFVLTEQGPVQVFSETKIDTIITIDSETFEEVITYEKKLYRYFNDTIIEIDPKTNKEEVIIITNYVYPEDLIKN